MSPNRLPLIALVALCSLDPAARAADAAAPATRPAWVNISDPVVADLVAQGKKLGYPGQSAGVIVDIGNGGAVYLVIAGQGLWRSTDQGATFALAADPKVVGGRCETSYSIDLDASGPGRFACFMLDGKCASTLDAGKTWRPMADVGRNWDYAAVDWADPDAKTIFALRHEAGGEIYLSRDAGRKWEMIGKDAKFAAVGLADAQTLLTTKGDGILRSTDAGKTWNRVSDLTPVGRVARPYNGALWWLAKEGLIVSRDKGLTWAKVGVPVNASIGPWFASDRHIVVAGKAGFFETTDAGQTWALVTAPPVGYTVPMPGWFANLTWDPATDVFYASQMGKPAWKYRRGAPAAAATRPATGG